MANKIQIRRDTTANWTAVDPVLSQGELGLDIVLKQFKIGDGQTVWSALDFFVGVQGPQGPAGIDGTNGIDGIQGPPGEPGATNELINGSHTVSLNPNGLVLFPTVNDTRLHIEGSEIFGLENSPVVLSTNSSVVINTYNPNLHSWQFNNNGSLTVPVLSVDLHNGGIQDAQTFKFNDPSRQIVITGPTPDADVNAQRIIIQGPRGTGNGEGGDVYLWGGDADVNGGDIKIYAGDGDASPSNGGYVHISGGSGYTYGGDVTINAGGASEYGGNVAISAGYAGGQTGTHGRITLNSGNHQWEFAANGVLTLPTSQFNTAQVFAQGGIDLLIGNSTHFWEFKDNQTLVFPDSTIQTTAYRHVTPPTHSYGAVGDKAGMIAFDSSYMYYCTANYSNDTPELDIWKRTAYTAGTW